MKRALTCDVTERRVLRALLTHPEALAAADLVEQPDFADYRAQVVFGALRELQASDAEVNPTDVVMAIQLRDLEHETHHRENAGAAYVAELLATVEPYETTFGTRECAAAIFENDLTHLRELAERRRTL